MYYVILIGAGKIGSRHLQGLAKTGLPMNISVVDADENSLQTAKDRYEEISPGPHPKNISYFKTLDLPEKNFDLAIIATNAPMRARITEELLSKSCVKSIVFEKVLFQKEEEYIGIRELLCRNNVKAWVNCSRRLYPFYHEIKNQLAAELPLTMHVQGGNWGLASNAIHCIDLFAFFIDSYEYSVTADSLCPDVLESKRPGFLDVFGTLVCNFSDSNSLLLSAKNTPMAPDTITIQSAASMIVIDEGNRVLFESKKKTNWDWNKKEITPIWQSDMTRDFVSTILTGGECGLCDFERSSQLHLPLLKTLIAFISKQFKSELNYCPIT